MKSPNEAPGPVQTRSPDPPSGKSRLQRPAASPSRSPRCSILQGFFFSLLSSSCWTGLLPIHVQGCYVLYLPSIQPEPAAAVGFVIIWWVSCVRTVPTRTSWIVLPFAAFRRERRGRRLGERAYIRGVSIIPLTCLMSVFVGSSPYPHVTEYRRSSL